MREYIRCFRKRLKEGTLSEIFQEMKWVLRHSIRYKWAVLWYILLGVLSTVMGLGTGVVSKYIIDAVTGYDSSAIIPAAAGYLSMNLFQIFINAVSSRVSARIRIFVRQEIQSDVFEKVLLAEWEALSEYHSGDLLNRVNNDVNSVATSVLGWIPDFVTSVVRFLATFFLILYYDPTMAALALASAPVTLLMSRVLMTRMRSHNVRMLEVNSEITAFHEETFQNLQYIKAFDLVKKYGEIFQGKQGVYKEVQLDYNKFTVYTAAFMSLIGMVVTSLCFGWGVFRLWSGAITYGTMTLFLQQAGNLSAAFSGMVNMVPNAISASTSAGRIMAVTELPSEEEYEEEETEYFKKYAARHNGVSIYMDRVSFAYKDGKEVLSEASMFVRPGEIIALVGPSGEGKTTILKILLGLVHIGNGEVRAEAGEKSLNISPSTRRLFAYVPQGNTMMSGTIAENLRLLNSRASEEELWEVLQEVCADDFVQKLPQGLDTYLKERGGGLSEGQLQRLSIARALLCDAPVLLLDEATSALDVATERKLLKNVMASAKNKTCIVTTHRPSVLTACNRVYRVGELGTELLDEPAIRKIILEF